MEELEGLAPPHAHVGEDEDGRRGEAESAEHDEPDERGVVGDEGDAEPDDEGGDGA